MTCLLQGAWKRLFHTNNHFSCSAIEANKACRHDIKGHRDRWGQRWSSPVYSCFKQIWAEQAAAMTDRLFAHFRLMVSIGWRFGDWLIPCQICRISVASILTAAFFIRMFSVRSLTSIRHLNRQTALDQLLRRLLTLKAGNYAYLETRTVECHILASGCGRRPGLSNKR